MTLNRIVFQLWIPLVSLLSPFWCFANFGLSSMVSGSAVIPPRTIENLVKTYISEALEDEDLQKSIQVATRGKTFSLIQTSPSASGLNPTQNEILRALGLTSPVTLKIGEVRTRLSFPPQAMQLKVQQIGPYDYRIDAALNVTRFDAQTEGLWIQVPRGVFDQSFMISATPVKIGVQPQSPAIRVQITLDANLSPNGTRLKLTQLKTNLTSQQGPNYIFDIGQLQIDGQPLSLQIQSGSQILTADERALRQTIKDLEPELVAHLKAELDLAVKTAFRSAAERVSKIPPLKVQLKTDSILADQPNQAMIKQLFSGIDVDFTFSKLQYGGALKYFTAEISSYVCFDQQCLFNNGVKPNITSADLASIPTQDSAGMLIHENWVQNVFHSAVFQSRVKQVYQTMGVPGINLAQIKVFFNPQKNSFDLNASLEIDIKKTAKPGSKFGERLRLRMGSLIERIFGAGKIIRVPVVVSAQLGGFRQTNGKKHLILKNSLNITRAGEFTNPYNQPSNVSDMTQSVRNSLLKTIFEEVSELVPSELALAVPDKISVKGFEFEPEQLRITPNKVLLFTVKRLEKPRP